MEGLGELLLLMGGVFAVSYVISRALVERHPRRSLPDLPPHAKLRLLAPSGTYRCHLLAVRGDGLTITAPLHRDSHVPLRVGEVVVAQTCVSDGIVTFRSTVLGRDKTHHQFTLSLPEFVRTSDRRSEPRLTTVSGQQGFVNGVPVRLVDLSAGGAKIELSTPSVCAGDWCVLELPDRLGVAEGHALELSDGTDSAGASVIHVRMCFDSPLSLLRAAE